MQYRFCKIASVSLTVNVSGKDDYLQGKINSNIKYLQQKQLSGSYFQIKDISISFKTKYL